jgi:hypothetical protein
MFKKFLNKAVVLSMCMFIVSVATNANATPIAASANVVGNITVTQNTALNFGQFSVGTVGGTVRFDAGGVVGVTGDVVHLGSEIGGIADLNTQGAGAGTAVVVTVVGTTLDDGFGNSMNVAGNCKGPGAAALGADNGTCTFNALPALAEQVQIGGIVTVNANQAAGVYNGNIAVTAAF